MISQIKFNVAYIKLSTKTEGPYNRCCIWFQGCNIFCEDCCNKDLQPLVKNHILSIDELIDIVKEAKERYNIEGITLTGGEPSLQRGLSNFNNEIHQLGLGIIMFSGKYLNELDPELVQSVDLLIDGPYIKSKKDSSRILIGSTNKKLNFITDRYKAQKGYFFNKVSLEEVVAEDFIFINGD